MKNCTVFTFTLFFLLLFGTTLHAQNIWYVNHAAQGNNTGTSPADAFVNLDLALSAALDSDTIKVAVGTYRPAQILPGGTIARDNSFYITQGIILLGGYNPGFNERDIYLYTTNLDGDLGANGSTADNSYHVIVINAAGKSAAIDGFTIQNGNADVATTVSAIERNNGAGIYVKAIASLTVSNTTFTNNTATGNGGAIYNGSSVGGSSIISQTLFVQNTAGLGGAIYSITGGAAGFNRIVNTTFSKNMATNGGGGAVYLNSTVASSSKIAYSTFNGNAASNNAGNAIYYGSGTGVVKELKGNLIYGNGTGINSEVFNPYTTSNAAIYNLVRNQTLAGNGNVSIADNNAENIFYKMAADGTSELEHYGGSTKALMPVRLGFVHNKIPAANASLVDPISTDQRGDIRVFDDAAEMGAIEIDWKWPACTGNTTWYVDGISGATLNNGDNINLATKDLSIVLANPCLKAGDTIKVSGSEIGDGLVYRPTIMLGTSTTSTSRDRSFYINKNVTLLGGYDNQFQRNVNTYKTILDGDWGIAGDNTDNSYHVVVVNVSGGGETAIDGFIIRNGNANGVTTNVVVPNAGGAIFHNAGKLNINHVSFQNNFSNTTGGAIHSIAVLASDTVLSIDHSSFLSNTAITNGGAIYRNNANGRLNITKSTFANNNAVLGGALYSDVNNAANLNYISNSTFSGNRASGANGGGAVYFNNNIAGISKIVYSTFNANTATSNIGNAIRYGGTGQKELKGNLIYGNGTGANTEIASLGTSAGITYNIIRDLTVTGTGNVANQNIPAGNAGYIFANTVGDSAILADNGGVTKTLMLTQGSFAQNRIPAYSIDSINTDQRDEPRYTTNFSIGSVELPLVCNPDKVWYVDVNAAAGGTGLSPASPINDLSLLLSLTCLQTNDTVKVAKGNYKPTTIPIENTSDQRDRNFLIPLSIHLQGGYEADFSEATRETTGVNTILDGDLGTPGLNTDNAYHVVVWNTTDGQTGSMNGFTIQNGNGNLNSTINGISRFKGAGLNLNQGSLTLSNTIIKNNSVSTSGNIGGGIYTAAGTSLTLDYSTVSNNTAIGNGGAIYAFAPLTISNTVISNNSTTNGTGGVYAEQLLVLHNATIAGNTGTAAGAGVYAKDALQLSGKVVADSNISTAGSGAGIYKHTTGAVLAENLDTLIITNNRTTATGAGFYIGVAMEAPNLKYLNVSDNITGNINAGGIYAAQALNLSNADSIIVKNNRAGQNGGGIYAGNILTLSAKNIILENNKAGTLDGSIYSTSAYHGGAIYAANAFTLSGKIVADSNIASGAGGAIYKVATGNFDVSGVDTLIVTNNQARNGQGGAINVLVAVATGSMDFTNLKYAEIKNNSASTHAGGFYATNSLNIPNADRIIIEDNKAGYNVTTGLYSGTNHGGGIYVNDNLTLSGKMILRNNIAANSGGGIYKTSSTTNAIITTLLDSLIAENNEAKTGQGGAMYVAAPTDFLTPRGWFTGNKAALDGGAIHVNATSFSISDYTFSNNLSKRNGGAISVFGGGSSLNLSGNMKFENNTADTLGGAVYINTTISVASLESIQMIGNKAGVSGGGIYTKGDIQFYSLTSGEFTNNKALTQNGGAIYGEKECYIQNAVFSQNQAALSGGAIYAISKTDIKKSFFKNNTADTAGAVYKGAVGVLNVSQSTFAGNAATHDGGAVASYYGTNSTAAASQQYFTNNTFSGNKAGIKGGAIYFAYPGGASNLFTARATISFCSFNSNTSGNALGNAIHYEKTTGIALNTLGTLFGNIICNGPTGSEINDVAGFITASSQYNIIRDILLPGTGNQNVSNADLGNIFETIIGDSAVLADNGGITPTLLIKKDGLAQNKIPQASAITYATNDQRDENRIVDLADIGSVELEENNCLTSTLDPVVWYVDISNSPGGDGTLSTNPAQLLETVLNNPCLKDRDTVKIAQGIYASTNTDAAQSFFVTKAIVIKGGYATGDFSESNRNIAANATVLDGMNTSYHVVVWNSSENYASIIDGVTIQKGKATGSITTGSIPQNKGGGLFLCLGNLILSNTITRNNIAANSGGGIFSSEDATLTLQSTKSEGNKAGYNGSTFTTVATGKTLIQQLDNSGGGVCAVGQLTLTGSISFQNDEAGVNGGGILKGTFNTFDASRLDSLTMTGCVARVTTERGEHGGGGIFTMCGLDLTSAKKMTFINCTAPASLIGEGGGIFLCNKTGRLVSLRVANAEFINCDCGDDGGALESYGGTVSLVYAKDCYFRGCDVGRYGGAIGSGHALELAGKIVMDSCISGTNGGGISQWTSGGTKLPVMFNASQLDTLIITNCGTKATTSGTFGGGGIWISDNECNLSNVKYLYLANNFSGEQGGGIKMQGNYRLILPSNAIFINNKAGWNGTAAVASRQGGAIYGAGDVEMKGKIQLDSNTASQHGGAISVAAAKIIFATTLDTLIMRGNKALNGSGGGLYSPAALDFSTLKYGEITGNSATADGGAIYANNVFSIINANFLNNKADNTGGAIWKSATGKITINKSTFAQNQAKNGGAIYNGIQTSLNSSTFINSTFSQNQATSGTGGAIYMAADHASTVSRILFCSFNGNTATGTGDAVYYANPTGEVISGSIIYGNGTSGNEISNTIGLAADYNVFKQSVLGTENIQVPGNQAATIFKTIGSGETAVLENNGGKSKTLALKIGGYAHNVVPANIGNIWLTTYVGDATDQRDSARFVGCKVDAGAYELQASEYDLSGYTLRQNFSVCGDVWIDADTLITHTVNMKDTLYFSDKDYTQPLAMPVHGYSHIYVKFLSATNCEFYDTIKIGSSSVVPVAKINTQSLIVCPGSTGTLRESTVPPQTGVFYHWSNFENFSDSYSGNNTSQLSFTAKSFDKDTTFYVYLSVFSGCGEAKDSCLVHLKGVQKVNINIPNNVISDACVSKPFNFTISTKNTSYYILQSPNTSNINFYAIDQDNSYVGNPNTSVKYDSAFFNCYYTPNLSDKGQNLTLIFRSTSGDGCGYRQDTMKFLVLPEATAARLEIVSQPTGIQKMCKDTVYTLKIKATNVGGLINNKISLVDMGNSKIIVDSAYYLYPVIPSPLETDWKSLGNKDSLTDPLDRAPRYQYDKLPNINGNDSMLIRFYVHAGCNDFRSSNSMKFKANVFDKCGTAVGIADVVSKPFKLETGESNTYTFDDSFTPVILNPKVKDSVWLRIKVVINGGIETNANTEGIAADYSTDFEPDLNTFQNIRHADPSTVTVTPTGNGKIRYNLPIPSGLKGAQSTFTDSVIFAVRCYTGNVPCGKLELWNQVSYKFTTEDCGSSCEVTEIRAQSIDTISIQRYAFALTEEVKGTSQLGVWGDTIDVVSLTPFLANDSIKIQFFVDRDSNSRYSPGDVEVYSGHIYSGAGVNAGGVFQVPFADIPYESGYQLIAYSDDVKMCDTMTIPVNVISGPDTVCQGMGYAAVFEAPAGMIDYSWDAISGATTVPDASLPPNKIKKGFETASGNVAITGTYRRVIYNKTTQQNDTVQAARSTFKFYINSPVQADSITIVGNDTEICTPAIIKLYAKNLQNAAAHQWIASTDAGQLLGENTDTLTYTVYPRATDTTILVYYTATGLTACRDWKDTIQLTLYQTLTQPAPAFSDSVICKGENIQIDMDIPSGGGTTAYTYQWQDSTRTRGWQNATGTYIGYTNTDQNYLTEGLFDTTWYRRIAVGKCDKDTGAVVTVNVRATIATVSFTGADSLTICSGDTKDLTILSENGTDIIWTYIDNTGQRQELLYPADNITGIGATTITADKKQLTLVSEKQLNDVLTRFEATAKDKCGDVKDTIKVLLRGYPTGKIVEVQDTMICYDRNFDFANVITNATYIGFETTGIGHFNIENSVSVNYQYDSVINYYRPSADEANSTIKLRMKYRNDVCPYQYDSVNIFVLPKITRYAAELITQPVGLQEVCTDTVYEIKIKATDPGNLENVKFSFNDNLDSRLSVKRFSYKYPYDAADWSYVADSTVLNRQTTWTIPDSIHGGDSLLVQLKVSAICGFQSGLPVRFHINLTDVCDHPMADTTLITDPFRTIQDTLMKGSFQVLTSFNGAALNTTGSIVMNSQIGDTVVWRLVAIPSSVTLIDTNRQSMQVTMPLLLPPIEGSYTKIKNAPDYNKIIKSVHSGSIIMQIPVLPGLAGDSCIVEFKFVAGRAPCGFYNNLSAEVIFRDSVKCGTDTCPFMNTYGSVQPTVDVQRYAFALDTIKGYTREGFWYADINLKALNGFYASDSLKIDFYVDENNSNHYDPADGNSVATRYLKTDVNIPNGGILKVRFDSIPVTYGKQLIAYSNDTLLCTITQFPVTILTSSDQICTSDTTLLVFPEDMTDYHTDAISGATAVPLPGSSPSNYPNENVRQIRWTSVRTVDTIVFSGSYRRGGSSGPLSEKASFIAIINNAITYDSLDRMGYSQEICSPETIQISAKNVKYATARQWTASTEAGTLINATTDTLTYVINPRQESDTTIWIFYHATAAGVCKDLRDSVQLTIYKTLSQPAPEFLDTTVCQNAIIDINMDEPTGGGLKNSSGNRQIGNPNATAYAYQWQDSVKNGVWQNIDGATEQNYTTVALSDTTWFRRIVTAKCDIDTGLVVRIAVYPPLEVKSVKVHYPLCMDDSIRISWELKGGKLPYMYSFDNGTSYNKLTLMDSVTADGYSVFHIDTLLFAGSYHVIIFDSSLCVAIDSIITIKPNSASAEPQTDVLFVKTNPSGDADGSSWDNAFDGQYLAWYLKNKAIDGTKVYVAEGTYIPYLDSCDNMITKRTYSFELNKNNMQIIGGFAANASGIDISSYSPNVNITRLSGEIQKDADNTNNSYHVVRIAQNASVYIQGLYISDGYADGTDDASSENGGGILDFGTGDLVTVSQTTLENNAAKFGSAVYFNKNTQTIMDSVTIQNNKKIEISYGGSIFAWGDFLIKNSAIINNTDNDGITSWGGNMGILNTTISGNGRHGVTAQNPQGDDLHVIIINTTITDNAEDGVHLDNNKAKDKLDLTLRNSLLLDNSTNLNIPNPIDTIQFSYSIIGNTKYITGANDIYQLPIPVALGPLAYNGGFTLNRALLNPCENPAVQTGDISVTNDNILKYDQRGILRKNPPSIGAYDNDEAILITLDKPAYDTVCANTPYGITSNIILPFSVNVTGYQWYKNGAAITDSTRSLIIFDSIKTTDAGKYSVLVTTDKAGCSRMSDTVNVFVHPAPHVTLTDDAEICFGDKVTLTFTLEIGALLPQWEIRYKIGTEEQTPLINSAGTNTIQIQVSPSQTSTYTVTEVKDGNGCVTGY